MKMSLLSGYFNILKKIKLNQIVFLFFITGASFLVSGLCLNFNYYQDKIYPQTSIDGIDVSGLTINQAILKLDNLSPEIDSHQLEIFVDDISSSSSSAELGIFRNYKTAANLAYASSKSSSKSESLINLVKAYFKKSNFESEIWYQERKIDQLILNLLKNVEIKGKPPEISLNISGNESSISVFEGEPGRTIDFKSTKMDIEQKINQGEFSINATVASTSAILTKEQIESETLRAKQFVGKSLELRAENKKFVLSDIDLISLIEPLNKYRDVKIDEFVDGWTEDVNRPAQDAEFDYDRDTLLVKSFKPHKDGLEIDRPSTKKMIISWLEKVEAGDQNKLSKPESDSQDKTENPLASAETEDDKIADTENDTEENILEIPLNRTNPKITLESTNDLGIKERIGFGESYYYHSIINRIHNVGITAERISLTIVPPGEEFSFNKTLGEVSARTGYRSAYVISGGKTVLGDGGGVCQVSSTLFRAVLDAGLKVTKRLQHSYRVSYYELNSQPGFDATVYSGDIDFRFINDTDHHILIFSYVEPDNLYMNIEIYGTSDGRTTEISNYKKWDFRSPPAPEYFPTTDLPTGVVNQVDWAVSGIKTEFTHTIKDKFGEVIDENVYYSNYRPWSAKYMKGV